MFHQIRGYCGLGHVLQKETSTKYSNLGRRYGTPSGYGMGGTLPEWDDPILVCPVERKGMAGPLKPTNRCFSIGAEPSTLKSRKQVSNKYVGPQSIASFPCTGCCSFPVTVLPPSLPHKHSSTSVELTATTCFMLHFF